MKKILVLLCLMAFALGSFGQSDAFDSTEYINGLPVTNDDTVSQSLPDRPPKDVLIEVPHSEIPKRLRKSLDKHGHYRGWERRGVFRDRNTGLYVVFVSDETSTRIYGLNENGRPVSFDEHSTPPDSIE